MRLVYSPKPIKDAFSLEGPSSIDMRGKLITAFQSDNRPTALTGRLSVVLFNLLNEYGFTLILPFCHLRHAHLDKYTNDVLTGRVNLAPFEAVRFSDSSELINRINELKEQVRVSSEIDGEAFRLFTSVAKDVEALRNKTLHDCAERGCMMKLIAGQYDLSQARISQIIKEEKQIRLNARNRRSIL